MTATRESVRLVVLGDAGVGKTCLVNLICHKEIGRIPRRTVGCNIDAVVHVHSDGTEYLIELWDIGGSKSEDHTRARRVFYRQPMHGLLLVHDLTNRRSRDNLVGWIHEANAGMQDDAESFVGSRGGTSVMSIPMLALGTKKDIADRGSKEQELLLDGGFNVEEVHTTSKTRHISDSLSEPGQRLAHFFDRVIDQTYGRKDKRRRSDSLRERGSLRNWM